MRAWMMCHGMDWVVEHWEGECNENLRKKLTKSNIIACVLVGLLVPFVGWVLVALWLTVQSDVDSRNYYDKSYGAFLEEEQRKAQLKKNGGQQL